MGRRGPEVMDPEPGRRRSRPEAELSEGVDISEPLPPGEVLTDVKQKQWRVGQPIGRGSFGEIYLASDAVGNEVTLQNARYVIKIEPHSNGPLFVEVHCLIRTARQDMIKQWCEERNVKSLGMPHYVASGSHILRGTRLRFLVLPRYGRDLRLPPGRLLPTKSILVLAAQVLDVLEYLHAQGYTHSDIKSSNLTVGRATIANATNVIPASNESPFKIPRKQLNLKQKSSRYDKYYEDNDFKVAKRKMAHKKVNGKLFNLRKLNSSVNYEEFNSSVCSDSSYQTMIDDGGNCVNAERLKEKQVFGDGGSTQCPGQVYLLDYGLASKFLNSDGTHKEFGMDQRKAHDGTLEYSSRDSHIGAHSRRSDLENLGYNVLDWLTGSLPWKTPETLQRPDLVHAIKQSCMKDVKRFLESCFKSAMYPKFLEKYFNYVTALEFAEKPDYHLCKKLFIDEFVHWGFGAETDMKFSFSNESVQPVKKLNYSKKCSNNKRSQKNTGGGFLKRSGIAKLNNRENVILNTFENGLKMNLIREGLNLSNEGQRRPCASRNFYVSDAFLMAKLRLSLLPNLETPSKKFSPKNLRSKKRLSDSKKKRRRGVKTRKSSIGKFGNFLGSGKQYTWAEILAGNPEDIIRKVEKDKQCQGSNDVVDAKNSNKKPRSRKVSNASELSVDLNASPNLLRKDFLKKLNPTYAMRQVVANYRRKINGRSSCVSEDSGFEDDGNENGYTPAMVLVLKNKEKWLQKERLLQERETKRLNFSPKCSGKIAKKSPIKGERIPRALRQLFSSTNFKGDDDVVLRRGLRCGKIVLSNLENSFVETVESADDGGVRNGEKKKIVAVKKAVDRRKKKVECDKRPATEKVSEPLIKPARASKKTIPPSAVSSRAPTSRRMPSKVPKASSSAKPKTGTTHSTLRRVVPTRTTRATAKA